MGNRFSSEIQEEKDLNEQLYNNHAVPTEESIMGAEEDDNLVVEVEKVDGFDVDFTPDFAKVTQIENQSLSWENLSLSIGKKKILKNIYGHVSPGEVTAILGPSGAGKSSLLNILAGRILNTGKKRITGRFLVNGTPTRPTVYRKNIAYVMQQDSLFATATCREALLFSANLRLPKTVSKQKKREMVEDLLVALGLTGCADTMIGSELVRGISGGEKKRVAIGVELVTQPSILFLDEPTSGLDSYNAWKTVQILRALAESGCAILCTVHQPSSEIFALFSNVILLSQGQCMYNGILNELPDVYKQGGYPIPPMTNPADYVMMLLQTKDLADLPAYNLDTKETTESLNEDDIQGEDFNIRITASIWQQSYYLMMREFRNLFRDKAALIGRFAITSVLNLLFAFIFFQVGDIDKDNYDILSHFGAIVNLFITGLFGATQPPLLTFPLERVVFLREYSTGSYGAIPYLISKILVEIPLNGIQSLLVVVIAYWLMALQANFVALVCSIWLIQLSSASYAFLIGALVPDAKAAQEIAPAVLVPQLLFAGFFIAIDQIPELLQWVQYVCALKFAINLGTILEFRGICEAENQTADIVLGCERLFEGNDVDIDLAYLYVLILVAIFVVFRTLSLVALVWRAKNYTN